MSALRSCVLSPASGMRFCAYIMQRWNMPVSKYVAVCPSFFRIKAPAEPLVLMSADLPTTAADIPVVVVPVLAKAAPNTQK